MKWAVAYINNKKRDTIGEGLNHLKIKHEIGIPLIRILRKQFKNKQYFESIPLLFNYGFIKLPHSCLKSKEKLIQIKEFVPGINNWMYKKKDKKGLIVQVVSDEEVQALFDRSDEMSVYSSNELTKFKKGDFITLKGYPFDGLTAEIDEINSKNKRATVNLFIMDSIRKVDVSFDNIFYSIYSNFDESLYPDSLDEIGGRYKNSLDRFEFKRSKK